MQISYAYRLPRQGILFFFVCFLKRDILLKIILLYGRWEGPHDTGVIILLFFSVR